MNKATQGISHFLCTIIVCLQFMFAPISVYAATDNEQKYADQYSGDDYMLQQIQQCDSINGDWNSSTNRCIAQKEDQEKADRTKQCMEIEDTTQRNQCFEQLAKDDAKIGDGSDVAKITAEEEEDAKKTAEMMKWWGVVQLIISSVLGSAANSDCYSVMISSKVGLANSLVSLGVYFFADDGTEELRSEYEKKVNSNAFDAQTGAYTFLKKEQEMAKEVAERDEMIHRFTAYGYTAASIVAIGEMLIPTKMAEGYGCVTEYSDLQTMAEAMKGNVMVQGEDGSVRKINEQEAKELAIGKDTDLKAIKQDGEITGYQVTRTKDGITTVTDGNLDGTKFTSESYKDINGKNVKVSSGESTYGINKTDDSRVPILSKKTSMEYHESSDKNATPVVKSTETSSVEYKYKDNDYSKPYSEKVISNEVKTFSNNGIIEDRKFTSDSFKQGNAESFKHVTHNSTYMTVGEGEDKKVVVKDESRKVELPGEKRTVETQISRNEDGSYGVSQNVNGKPVYNVKNASLDGSSSKDLASSPTTVQVNDKGVSSVTFTGDSKSEMTVNTVAANSTVKGAESVPVSATEAKFKNVKLDKGQVNLSVDENSGNISVKADGLQVDGKAQNLDYSRNFDENNSITESGGFTDIKGQNFKDQLSQYQTEAPIKDDAFDVKQAEIQKEYTAKLEGKTPEEVAKIQSEQGYKEAEALIETKQKEIGGIVNNPGKSVLKADGTAELEPPADPSIKDIAEVQKYREQLVEMQAKLGDDQQATKTVLQVEQKRVDDFLNAQQERIDSHPVSVREGFSTKVNPDQSISYTESTNTVTLGNGNESMSGSGTQFFGDADKKVAVSYSIGTTTSDNTTLTKIEYKANGEGVVTAETLSLSGDDKTTISTNLKDDKSVVIDAKDRDAYADAVNKKVAELQKASPEQIQKQPAAPTKSGYEAVSGSEYRKQVTIEGTGKNAVVKGVPVSTQKENHVAENMEDGSSARKTAPLTGDKARQYQIMEENRVKFKYPDGISSDDVVIMQSADGQRLTYNICTESKGCFPFDDLGGKGSITLADSTGIVQASDFSASNTFKSSTDLNPAELKNALNKIEPPKTDVTNIPEIKTGGSYQYDYTASVASEFKTTELGFTEPTTIVTPDPTSPDYIDLMWENVKNEQERFSPARKYDQDSSYFEPLFKKNDFKFATVELTPGYIETLERSVKQTASSTDGMFAFIETQSFYAHTATHSPRLDEYNQAVESGRYEIPELDGIYSLPESLVNVAKVTKLMYNKIIPRLYAKESFGDKAGNVIYGGNDQELDFDSILFGGGMAGSMIRGAAVGYLFQTLMPGVRAALYPLLANLISVSVINGINAGFQYKLADHSKKQIELCDKRIALLDDALAQFNRIDTRYCLQGRDDLGKPECYCYNEDGTKNTSHANSATCQQYWAQKDQYEQFVAAGNYSGQTAKNACITINGQYDANCKCRAYKDKTTGQNACMKSSPATTSTVSLANAAGMSGINNVLDSIYSGDSTSAGTFNSTSGVNLAARQAKVKKALENKVNKMLLSKGQKPLPNEKSYNKIMKGILNKAKLSPSAVQGLKNKMASQGLSPKAQKALDKAIKKSGVGSKYSRSKGINKAQKKKENFDFGLDGGTPAQMTSPKFMDKKYKYKQNDIVKNKGVSIFKVISLRYQQTGMERLFPDEE